MPASLLVSLKVDDVVGDDGTDHAPRRDAVFAVGSQGSEAMETRTHRLRLEAALTREPKLTAEKDPQGEPLIVFGDWSELNWIVVDADNWLNGNPIPAPDTPAA